MYPIFYLLKGDYKVPGLGFMVQGLGFMAEGLGLRVWCLGSCVDNL